MEIKYTSHSVIWLVCSNIEGIYTEHFIFLYQGADNMEDSHSIGVHMKAMAEEMEKQRPSHNLLKDLMTRTAPSRAASRDTLGTVEVLEQQPYLKDPHLVRIIMYTYS